MKLFFNNSEKYGKRNSTKYRTYDYVLSKCVEEQGELSQEIQIVNGLSYKDPGKDGVRGEAVDLAIAALDMFALTCDGLDASEMEELFMSIAEKKIQKWNEKTPPNDESVQNALNNQLRYTNTKTGIHYSRFTDNIGLNIDEIATWSDPYVGTLYLENPAEVLGSSFPISNFGGDEVDVEIVIDLYDNAKELFSIFNDKIDSKIILNDIDETRSIILFKTGAYGVIVSDLHLRKYGITHPNIITLNKRYTLTDLFILACAEDKELRTFKRWLESEDMEMFVSAVQDVRDSYNSESIKSKMGIYDMPSQGELKALIDVLSPDLPELYWEGAFFYREFLLRKNNLKEISSKEYFVGDEIKMEYGLGSSNKFYNVTYSKERTVKISYGKVGATETYQLKTFNSAIKAEEYFIKKVQEKFKSGYVVIN